MVGKDGVYGWSERWGRDEAGLDQEENGGDPLDVGDVEGDLAGVGDEGECEEEGGFTGDGQAR